MANRTIYLPEELDEISRRLGLNLSRLTQEAIQAHVAEHGEQALDARVDAASERISLLGLEWPAKWLETSRAEAEER